MLIPQHIFAVSKICDSSASRYVLGAVKLERDENGKPHAIATDGRVLIHATWNEDDHSQYPPGVVETVEPKPGFECLVPEKQWNELLALAKKVGKCPKKILQNAVLDEVNCNGTVSVGATDIDTARTLKIRQPEGRFPRWTDVIPKYDLVNQTDVEEQGLGNSAVRICLDADLLAKIAQVTSQSGGHDGDRPSIALVVPLDRHKPVLIESRGPLGLAEGVVMPLECKEWDREDKKAVEDRNTIEVEAVVTTPKNDEDHVVAVTYVTADELRNNGDKIAPVSGYRCRSCGHNANRDAEDVKWAVINGTAYCPKCIEQAMVDQGIKAAEVCS